MDYLDHLDNLIRLSDKRDEIVLVYHLALIIKAFKSKLIIIEHLVHFLLSDIYFEPVTKITTTIATTSYEESVT